MPKRSNIPTRSDREKAIKAIIIGSGFPYTYGGIETHVYYLVKYLSKTGENIQITLVIKNSQGKKYYEGVEDSCHMIKAGLPKKDFSSRRLASAYHWFGVVFFNLHAFIKLLTLKTDVIHYHYAPRCYDGLFIPILKLFKKKPIIITFHSMGIKNEYHSTPRKTPRVFLAYLLGMLIERALLLASNSIITVFPSDIKNSVYIPQGVDLNEFNFIEKNDYQRFVYLGRLDPSKSVMGILAAFGKICHDFPGELVLIGGGPQLGEIQEYVTKNLDNRRVKVLGGISNVNEELKKGGIFVLFSQFESFSLSTLEAMAVGLPTLITRVGVGFRFEDRKHTLFVKQGDIQDLAEKMLICYYNREMAEEIRQNAYEFVRDNFAWDKVASKTAELYQQVITTSVRKR